MTNKLRLVPAIAGLVAWLLTPTSAQSVDQSFYYKLSTEFRGDGMKLDVFNGGPKNNLTRLEPDQDVSGQFWRLVGNRDGTFSAIDAVSRPRYVPGHFQRWPEQQPATPRQLRQLHGPALEHHGDGGRRPSPTDDQVSRPRYVPGHFQRRCERQPATPRQLRQLHGSALDADKDRQARGGRALGVD